MKRLPLRPELLRAFLEGRKTVTRRLINPQPPEGFEKPQYHGLFKCVTWYTAEGHWNIRPKYQPGDIAGIGEPWCIDRVWNEDSPNKYLASRKGIFDRPHYMNDGQKPENYGRVRTGRFLPDALVRHKACIVSVRAERLQEITEDEVKKEGIVIPTHEGRILLPLSWKFPPSSYWPVQTWDEMQAKYSREDRIAHIYRSFFASLWDELHGKEAPWSSSPWVWRYEISPV